MQDARTNQIRSPVCVSSTNQEGYRNRCAGTLARASFRTPGNNCMFALSSGASPPLPPPPCFLFCYRHKLSFIHEKLRAKFNHPFVFHFLDTDLTDYSSFEKAKFYVTDIKKHSEVSESTFRPIALNSTMSDAERFVNHKNIFSIFLMTLLCTSINIILLSIHANYRSPSHS